MWALRGLRRARRRARRSAATASARSRCTCSATATDLYFGSEVEVHRRAARPHAARSTTRHLQRYLVNGYKALYKTARDVLRGPRGAAAPGALLAASAPAGDERAAATGGPRGRRPTTACRYEEAVAGTRERLIRSVELRLRADVPLAFCMSGGVDSMSLISIAKQRLRLRRARLHDRQLATSATRSRTWSSTRSRELGVRHTADPARHRRLPAAAARARAPPRRARLHDHLLRALAADGVDPRARLPHLGQRHGGRRAVHAATTTTTSPTCTRCATSRRCTPRSRRHLAASTSRRSCATRSCQDPDLLRRRPRLPRPHLPRRRRVRGLPDARRSPSRSPRRDYADDAAAQPDAQRAVRTRRCR